MLARHPASAGILLFVVPSAARNLPTDGEESVLRLYSDQQTPDRIYTGVTNDLARRVWEHKYKAVPGFTSRYNIDRLIYFESFRDPTDAIAREKQIKGYGRTKKVALIVKDNPGWKDLGAEWQAK